MLEFEVVHEPLIALERYFGFKELRSGQGSVIEAILAGRDTLVVMPTGGGKSLCYQLPALCRAGLALVVSPLIALMKDQVDALVARGIPATMINSSLSLAEQRARMAGMRAGEWKIIYVAPERFGNAGFLRSLREMDISLVAVDEAHCLSQWGHDFRPDYLRLGGVLEELGKPQIVALTATATQRVREDIMAHLRLDSPVEIVHGFARRNLHFSVLHCDKHVDKYRRVRCLVERYKTGIVYCSTRKKVESVYEELSAMGIAVVAYHAGLSEADREMAQNKFMSRESDVVVATNAFGMGIDRSDVRFVIHFEIPGSVEAYYQEAGRAGRDGEEAYCELLFNHADLRTQEFFLEGTNPSADFVRELYRLLCAEAEGEAHELSLTIQEMAERMGQKNDMALGAALSLLGRMRVIERFDIPGKRARGTRVLTLDKKGYELPLDTEAMREKERKDREKLQQVTAYAYGQTCRQFWIQEYFGENNASACGICDICATQGMSLPEPLGEEEVTIVRKALSGVARASRRSFSGEWEARFGRAKIMAMLRGSKASGVLNTSLSQLSTYGLLAEMGETELVALFRSMQNAGFIANVGTERPMITLTPRGEKVMRGEQIPVMAWGVGASTGGKRVSLTKKKQGARIPTGNRTGDGISGGEGLGMGIMGTFDEVLYEALRDLRAEIASRAGIPVFKVFSNAVLDSFARIKPTTQERALMIHGVGEQKARQWLKPFIELIDDYLDSCH